MLRVDGTTVAFDLDLESDRRLQPSPIPTADLAPDPDVPFIAHDYGDQFDRVTSRTPAEQSDCPFVVPANCPESAREYGVPERRIHVSRPFELFRIAGPAVEPKRAFHGHVNDSIYRGGQRA